MVNFKWREITFTSWKKYFKFYQDDLMSQPGRWGWVTCTESVRVENKNKCKSAKSPSFGHLVQAVCTGLLQSCDILFTFSMTLSKTKRESVTATSILTCVFGNSVLLVFIIKTLYLSFYRKSYRRQTAVFYPDKDHLQWSPETQLEKVTVKWHNRAIHAHVTQGVVYQCVTWLVCFLCWDSRMCMPCV